MDKAHGEAKSHTLDVWDIRKRALEAVFGPSTGAALHSPMPLALGGQADVLVFRHFVNGFSYVTADLTGGESGQVPNSLGAYEMLICVRKSLPTAANLVSKLGKYSLEHRLDPGETMDIGSYFDKSNIRALIFAHPSEPPASFNVIDEKCGLLLCIGITAEELDFKIRHGSDALIRKLKGSKIFPYTDPKRQSVK